MEKKNKKSGHKKLTLDTMANRILVVTLAILMTFQFCTSTFYGVSFAEDNLPQVEDEATGTVEGTDENPADEPGDVVDNQAEAPPADDEVTEPEQGNSDEPQTQETETEVTTPAQDEQEVDQPENKEDEPATVDEPSRISDETKEPESEVTEPTDKEDEPAGEDTKEEGKTEDKPEDEAKEEEPEDPMDPKEFTGSANKVNVYVYAPQGAFPEGTTMQVNTVKKAEVIDAVESVVDNVERVRAVDITFYDKDGKEIQPLKKVTVKLNPTTFDADANHSVVHIDDNGDANVVKNVDFDAAATGTEAEFKTKASRFMLW